MVNLGLTGDVMLGRLVNEVMLAEPSFNPWGNLLPLFQKTDLNLINLECALTRSEKIVPKVFNFKSDPKHVTLLKEARIDVVNLANNHILDYGEEGLLETLKTLDQASILHVGAGTNWEEATRGVILQRDGLKIGILGCTDNEPTWRATATKPGTFFFEQLSDLLPAIGKLRPLVDLLILSIHWGPNMQERPSKAFQILASQLLDAGVDIIHGHSAHIFQGIERVGEKIIFYDCGDFVDDYAIDPILRNDLSFFFEVDVKKKQIKLTPVQIEKFQVNLQKDAKESLLRMQGLSKELGLELKIQGNALIS